jgi:DNA-directed RNA polymerase subunit N (RpoN/RPB10)
VGSVTMVVLVRAFIFVGIVGRAYDGFWRRLPSTSSRATILNDAGTEGRD